MPTKINGNWCLHPSTNLVTAWQSSPGVQCHTPHANKGMRCNLLSIWHRPHKQTNIHVSLIAPIDPISLFLSLSIEIEKRKKEHLQIKDEEMLALFCDTAVQLDWRGKYKMWEETSANQQLSQVLYTIQVLCEPQLLV